MRTWIIVAAILGTALVGIITGIAVDQFALDGDADDSPVVLAPTPEAAPTPTPDVSGLGLLSQNNGCLSAGDVYEDLRPAVVEITATSSGEGSFGFPVGGTGTGIAIDGQGSILTNQHVIAGASILEVTYADGTVTSAELVGQDPGNDLAVIRVDAPPAGLTPASLGSSDALRVGDPVLAIGNPFNLEGTLTQGIVSGLNRTSPQGAGTRPIRDMIQTDAPVNPGNSGGPLLNCRGEVIGINTLLENPTGDNVNVGIAFAVSSDTANNSLPEMLAGETVSHPWLGIAGQAITPGLAEQLDLAVEAGVYVTLAAPGGPADDAGVRGAFESDSDAAASTSLPEGGDIITEADGIEMNSVDELALYLEREKTPGDTVVLVILRDGEELSLEPTLQEWPA